jgi:hypothetical protein
VFYALLSLPPVVIPLGLVDVILLQQEGRGVMFAAVGVLKMTSLTKRFGPQTCLQKANLRGQNQYETNNYRQKHSSVSYETMQASEHASCAVSAPDVQF